MNHSPDVVDGTSVKRPFQHISEQGRAVTSPYPSPPRAPTSQRRRRGENTHHVLVGHEDGRVRMPPMALATIQRRAVPRGTSLTKRT